MIKMKRINCKQSFLLILIIIFSYALPANALFLNESYPIPYVHPPSSVSCTGTSSGCYRIDGTRSIKDSSGSLDPESFAIYLPENKCSNMEREPDSSLGACACLFASSWNPYGKCCGDDGRDCGYISKGVLCDIDSNWNIAQWLASDPYYGGIKYVGCSKTEFLSDGDDWKKCEGDPWIENVKGNDFACAGKGRNSIAECCGDKSCASSGSGRRLLTGESVTVLIEDSSARILNSSLDVNPDSNITENLTDVTIFIQSGGTIIKTGCYGNSAYVKVSYDACDSSANELKIYLDAMELNSSSGYFFGQIACKAEIEWSKYSPRINTGGDGRQVVPESSHLYKWDIAPAGQHDSPLYIGAFRTPGCNTSSASISLTGGVIFSPKKYAQENLLTGNAPMSPSSCVPSLYNSCGDGCCTYQCLAWTEPTEFTPAWCVIPVYEDCSTCPSDCGACSTSPTTPSVSSGPKCGDENCGTNETAISCPADCAADTIYVNGTKPVCPSGYYIESRFWNSDTLGPLCGAEGGGSCYAPGGWGTYPSLGDSTYCCISGCHRCDSEVSRIFSDLVVPRADAGTWGWTSVKCQKVATAPVIKSVCPNSVCETNETYASCPQDCGKPKNVTLYCTPEGTFVKDLDLKEEEVADKVLLASRKKTCERAGLAWTGTKCCSEGDDQNEYYNDPSGKGACWNKQPVLNFDSAPNTNDSVASYNGQLHGCAIDKSVYNPENDGFLSLKDNFTSEALIENHPYCFTDPLKTFYCSFSERWKASDGANYSHISVSPLASSSSPAECCTANSCWDGNACIPNQKFNPLARPLDGKYLCVDGNWTQSSYKCAPDTTICTGFCPDDSQCLISTFYTNGSACIKSTEYVNDNYCQNGNWTTRTKLLAVQLMNLRGSGDYSLYCDKKENALNNLNYLSEDKQLVSSLLSGSPTNIFCVLRAANKTIIGTTLNRDLDAFPKSALSVFGISNCSTVTINDYEYHQCDTSNKVWYSKGMKSVIFSQSPISLAPFESEGFFQRVILGPIRRIIFSLNALNTTPPYDNSYLNSITKFDKLYMSQKGNRTVKAVIDGLTYKNFVGEYSGFSSDICKVANEYHKARADGLSGLSCRKDSAGNYYVLAQGSSSSNVNPEIIWPDLTAKLRYK